MIVPDASVIAKFFVDEPDRHLAKALLEHAVGNGIELIAPSLLFYEMLSIALRHDMPFATVHGSLESLRNSELRLVEPLADELQIAEKIATLTSRPSLQDSVYHAIAIFRQGTFVTADLRYVRKMADFGHVVALADWRPG